MLRESVSVFQDYAPIPAQKRLLAIATGDQRWANLRPPLTAMPEEKGGELTAPTEVVHSDAGCSI